MILCIDIGNSNIVMAFYKNGIWTNAFRYETKDPQPLFFYEQALRHIFLEWNISLSECKHIIISSVVPALTKIIATAVSEVTGNEAVIIDSSVYPLIDMSIPLHNEIGSDIVCNAYAATRLHHDQCIILDFGTALTFTIASKNLGITGVTITPGIKTAIHALGSGTALLPIVPLELPKSAIGTNTVSAIQAGVLWGYVGLVDGLLDKIENELGYKSKVVATGGLSSVLIPALTKIDAIDKMLTLDGMRLIYNHLKK